MAPVDLKAVQQRHPKKKLLLDDCMKVQKLLASGYGPALVDLETKLAQWVQKKGTQKKALTQTLGDAERYCGINPCAPIYMRFLSAEEFGVYGGKGMLFKDVGAGYLHGEYTHRIQWYVIFHAMSSGFTQDVKSVKPKGWNHTPRQLLIEINTGGIQLKDSDWPLGAPEGNRGFWDALVDRGPGVVPTFDPSTDGISNPEIFATMLMDKSWLQANHATLHDELAVTDLMPNYANCYGVLGATYPTLGNIVARRYAKRATSNLYADRDAYARKKIDQTKPKTAYESLDGQRDNVGVLVMSAEGAMEQLVEQERQKGHCFLTTACVTARGLPDDCEELQVLRTFRDGYLRRLPEGPALIEEYYARAPRIVELISRRDDARRIWEEVYQTLRAAVHQVQRHEPEAALRTYCALVRTLEARVAP